MNIKLFRKGDLAVIAAVAAVAVLLFAWRAAGDTENLTAVITVNGETVQTVDLANISERTEYRLDTTPEVLIVAENSAIYFEEAGCEDKLCIACGKLNQKGDTAVCLPARTVITVGQAQVDAVTY